VTTEEERQIAKLSPWCLHQMAVLTLEGVKFKLCERWEAQWGEDRMKEFYAHEELWQVIHLVTIARGARTPGLSA
jgi:hypothetical protein